MRLIRLLIIAVLAGTLVAACSNKQKEAERLEQQMKDQNAADSMAAEQMPADTTTPTEANAHAVPAETKPAVKAMPPAPMGQGYAVQVASCENQDYAHYLVDLYRGRGYEPYVVSYTQDGQVFYRVRVGNVATLAEARQIKAELHDKYSIDAWIDPNK